MMVLVAWTAASAEMQVNDIADQAQTLPVVAAFGPTVWVVYQDNSNLNDDVRLTVSRDGGQTFAPSALVHPPSDQDQRAPDIAVGPAGEAYVIWEDFRSSTDFDVFLSVTSDGENFSTPVRVHEVTKGSQLAPRVAVNPLGDVFAVWNDNRDSTAVDQGVRWDVYFSRSTDNGQTFFPSVPVSGAEWAGEPYFATFADVAAPDEDRVILTWFKTNWSLGNMRLRSRTSQDGGASFAPRQTLSAGPYMQYQRLEADSTGRAVLVWEDRRETGAGQDPTLYFGSGQTHDVYAVYSQDFGVTWSAPFRVNQEVLLNQQRPSVALYPGGWAVAWSDNRSVGQYTIRLATGAWPPSGLLAGEKVDGYDGPVERNFPSVAATGAGLCVVWQDFRADHFDLYLETR